MLITNKLTKRYDNGYIAVNKLSIHVFKGDVYGFLGPNGAGKTTTIRMITGLLDQTSGEVQVDGMEVGKHVEEIRRKIGVLPESHGYYLWMSGREYLHFFANMYGVPKNQIRGRVDELLERVGLAQKSNERIQHYSRGMKQRLGLAKAIVHSPRLIILDEPTLGLDPQGQRDIQIIIKELNEQLGVTIFITSHLLREIDELCNRVAIVKNGKILEEGWLSELKDKYRESGEMMSLEHIFLELTGKEEGVS
ncbi:ABC transporter ATP-binding protein [Gorillibacterium massiliense]|uniref:ABC transporter ATP-binding protein n=1 Tax=Gorillibacterium massiliense TaxID=1280390 RepID=UPI0004AF9CDF|nr:ABC transporter ATP-binding protein [Gorillibacterium massiliense]